MHFGRRPPAPRRCSPGVNSGGNTGRGLVSDGTRELQWCLPPCRLAQGTTVANQHREHKKTLRAATLEIGREDGLGTEVLPLDLPRDNAKGVNSGR